MSKWKVEYLEHIPQQENNYDFGMFAMNFARNVLSCAHDALEHNTFTFAQKDIPNLRRRFVLEICKFCMENEVPLRRSNRIAASG